jgi:hypothetical protein
VWKRKNRWRRPVTRLSAVARHGFDAPGARHRLRSDDGRYVDQVSTPEGWRGRALTYTVVLDDGSRHSIDVRFGRGERVRHRSR